MRLPAHRFYERRAIGLSGVKSTRDALPTVTQADWRLRKLAPSRPVSPHGFDAQPGR